MKMTPERIIRARKQHTPSPYHPMHTEDCVVCDLFAALGDLEEARKALGACVTAIMEWGHGNKTLLEAAQASAEAALGEETKRGDVKP